MRFQISYPLTDLQRLPAPQIKVFFLDAAMVRYLTNLLVFNTTSDYFFVFSEM